MYWECLNLGNKPSKIYQVKSFFYPQTFFLPKKNTDLEKNELKSQCEYYTF